MPVKVSPSINDSTAAALEREFPTRNAGAAYILDSWPTLYRATLVHLRGMFSTAELELILNALNGLILAAELAGQHLVIEVADACALNGAHTQHGVEDWRGLVARLQALSPFDRAALELWARYFWDHVEDHQDHRAYVAQLTDRALA